jgi:lipopolysaccharide transport system ATP-binding protein
MGDCAIHAEGLSKRYRIGVKQRYNTLRDSIVQILSAPVRKFTTPRVKTPDEDRFIWAIRDVSFDIRKGEVVGVIGRNGAGKSTLLKVLSRITRPTSGRAVINGRVGSLLEVGTGFHPELTGRENIYLNGAILGMHRVEIEQKFGEIVEFSEVEKFLDTPVKFYSSGMYVRLAFAVAAHLETEILLVDEVLAVGDNRFQTKCLNKMEQVGETGRTVLFVSHSMQSIVRLCKRVILVEGGHIVADGEPHHIVDRYLSDGAISSAERIFNLDRTNNPVRLLAVRVKNASGAVSDLQEINEPVIIEFDYENNLPGDVHVTMQLVNETGVVILQSSDHLVKNKLVGLAPGAYRSTVEIPANTLAEGRYFMTAQLRNLNRSKEKYLKEMDCVSFTVRDPSDGTTVRGNWAGTWVGVVRPMLNWNVKKL